MSFTVCNEVRKVPQQPLPPNKLSRRYHCDQCQLSTTRSRLYLFHSIICHRERQPVYLCIHCEYASRWRCKVVRHHSMTHKEHKALLDQEVPFVRPDECFQNWIACDRDMDLLLTQSGLKKIKFEDNLLNNKERTSLPTQAELELVINDQAVFPESVAIQNSESLEREDPPIVSICTVCDRVSETYEQLMQHMRDAHELVDCAGASTVTASSSNAIDLSIKSDSQETPMEVASSEHDIREREVGLVRTSGRKYRCTVCSVTFDWHGNLVSHLEREHNIVRTGRQMRCTNSMASIGEGDGAKCVVNSSSENHHNKCTFCDYNAKYDSELQRHMRLHLGLKPFKCRFCQYESAWKGDLKRHLESHHRLEVPDEQCLAQIMAEYKNNAGTKTFENASSTTRAKRQDVLVISRNSSQSELDQRSFIATRDEFEKESEEVDEEEEEDGNSNAEESSWIDTSMLTQPDAWNDELSSPTKTKREVTLWFCHTPECGYKTNCPDKLLLHASGHQERLLFRCPLCAYRANWCIELNQHLMANHLHHFDFQSLENQSKSQAQCDAQALQLEILNELLNVQSLRAHEGSLSPIMQNGNEHHKCTTESSAQPKSNQDSFRRLKSTSSWHLRQQPLSLPTRKDRRFRCNVCGHRSNWKWDINKHIKVAHPVTLNAHTVVMDHKDAEATLENYLTESALKPKPKEDARLGEEGYNRPYMCSKCGHRSNWKWDINKHIRQIHPGQGQPVTLSNEVAKQTLQEYIESKKHNHEMSSSARSSPSSVMSGGSVSKVSKETSQSTPRIDTLRLKRFRCTICGYRSNYRSDIVRHIKRKHGQGQVEIMSTDVAENSLELYVKRFPQKTNAFFRKSLPEHLREEIVFLTSEEADFQFDSNGHYKAANDKRMESKNDEPLDLTKQTSNCLYSKTALSKKCEFCMVQFVEPFFERFEHMHQEHEPQCDEDMMRLFWGFTHREGSANQSESGLSLTCPRCPFTTQRQEILTFHINLHAKECVFAHTCQHCGYRASRADFLLCHERYHDEQQVSREKQQLLNSNERAL